MKRYEADFTIRVRYSTESDQPLPENLLSLSAKQLGSAEAESVADMIRDELKFMDDDPYSSYSVDVVSASINQYEVAPKMSQAEPDDSHLHGWEDDGGAVHVSRGAW